jgi:hypothetical protein
MGKSDEKEMQEEADTGKRYEGKEEDFVLCCHLLGDLLLPLLSDLGLLLSIKQRLLLAEFSYFTLPGRILVYEERHMTKLENPFLLTQSSIPNHSFSISNM